MKNLIALLLTFALVLSLAACGQKTVETVPAAEQSVSAEMSLDVPTAGGWQRPASPAVPDEVKALLDKALEQMDGAVYTPVAYLGSQVVAGTNYLVLCTGTPTTGDAAQQLYLATVYADLQGGAQITDVRGFDLLAYLS